MNFEQPTVLVVDDMRTNCLILSRMLEPHGYRVIIETDSAKVFDLVMRERPTAILLDYEMPGMIGPEVCRQLKMAPATRDIPIIFVTSHTGQAEISEAFSAGADDYVLKPPGEQELVARLSRILLNLKLQAQVRAHLEEQTHITRIVSHDMNNLLMLTECGVSGMVRALRSGRGVGDPAFNREHERTLGGLERMRALVSNVQELQSLDDSKRAVVLEPISLRSILDECTVVFEEKLAAKAISLDVHCPAPLRVIGEFVSLSNSVVNNIISNAIKFSFRGGRITVDAEARGESVVVTIRDEGLGMDRELLARIFSPSAKTTRPGTGDEKGTGFGMPIVKRYMELFGGSVGVESVPHGGEGRSGTTFTLTFRRAPDGAVVGDASLSGKP